MLELALQPPSLPKVKGLVGGTSKVYPSNHMVSSSGDQPPALADLGTSKSHLINMIKDSFMVQTREIPSIWGALSQVPRMKTKHILFL